MSKLDTNNATKNSLNERKPTQTSKGTFFYLYNFVFCLFCHVSYEKLCFLFLFLFYLLQIWLKMLMKTVQLEQHWENWRQNSFCCWLSAICRVLTATLIPTENNFAKEVNIQSCCFSERAQITKFVYVECSAQNHIDLNSCLST